MTTHQIAAQLHARPRGRGHWVALCPAHGDRDPSLSIAEGRDGRTLLYCFAGCTIDSIARAAGLSMRDLFERDAAPRTERASARPSAAEVCRTLAFVERAHRDLYKVRGSLRLSEVNAIRAAVAQRYGIELAPIEEPSAGEYGGREHEPGVVTDIGLGTHHCERGIAGLSGGGR